MLDAVVTDGRQGSAGIQLGLGATGRASLHGDVLKSGDKTKVMIRPQNLHPVTAEMQTMPEPMHGGPGLAGTVSDVVVTGSLTKLSVLEPDTSAIVVAFTTRAKNGREAWWGWVCQSGRLVGVHVSSKQKQTK